MVRSVTLLAVVASVCLVALRETEAQLFYAREIDADASTSDMIEKQYCDNDKYHCIFLSDTATKGSLALDDRSKSITQAKNSKSGITIFALQDGASGHINVSCQDGKSGTVAFTFDNKEGNTAEITAGGVALNGIFKSKVGYRLESGKIASHQAGDDLNVYCSVLRIQD